MVLPLPLVPAPRPHRLPHLRSAAGDRRRKLQRLGRRAAPLLIAGAGPAAGDAGAGAGTQAAGDARLRGSGSIAGRRASSRESRAVRGRGGVGPAAPKLWFPPPALRGSPRTREGAARASRARGAAEALRGPGSRSASASRRRREKQQQVLRFSNPFQPLPLHQSAPPERARGRGSLLRWSRVPATQAGPSTRATPGPALRRWGCAPGAPRLGRARAEDDGGSQALSAPFPFTLFPAPHPQPEPARPAGWAGGGEVGGELCGAHRQWGSLAESPDAPGEVAKCRLCCSPGRRPRELALASSRGDRRGATRSKVVSRSRERLARSFPSLPPSAASGSLPPAQPGRSHAPSAALWRHFG